MAAPEVVRSGVGLRNVVIFALDASGFPSGGTATAYEGTTISGARALTLNDPEPQQIVHRGDDRIFALDTLPSQEPVSGELRVGKTNDTVDAILTDDLAFTVGETNMFNIGSDNRGDENQVGLLAYRQTLDTLPTSSNFGSRRWEFRLFPKTFIIPRDTGVDETPEDRVYTVRPQFITQHIWGTALTTGTEGAESAQGFRGVSEFKPKLIQYTHPTPGGGVVTLAFPTDAPAQATGKIKVWIASVATVPDTLGTTQISFTTAVLTTNAIVVVLYEVA